MDRLRTRLTTKSGKYYVIITYFDDEGTRRTKWRKTGINEGHRNDAEKERARIHQEILDEWTKKPTIADTAAEWTKEADLDPVTMDGYQIMLNAYILPYIGQIETERLTTDHIKNLYSELLNHGKKNGGGLSRESIKKTRSVLIHILKHAERTETISPETRNNLELVEIPKQKRQQPVKRAFLPPDLLNRLLETARDDTLYPALYMAVIYGMRRSEIAGLKWKSVNFATKSITIESTVTRISKRREMDRTKTPSSRRTYPMTAEAESLLKSLQPNIHGPEEYVIRGPTGKPISPDYMSKHIKKLLTKANLPDIRFHDLRHSCAAALLSQGFSLYDIKDWLGHAKIGTTADIYGHLDTSRKKRIGDSIERIISDNSRDNDRNYKRVTEYNNIAENANRPEIP